MSDFPWGKFSRRSRGIEKLESKEMLAANLGFQFDEDYILGYDSRQDKAGTVSVSQNQNAISLTGNTWKAVQLSYEVTPNTVIEFDFESTSEGEIHGIGIDADLSYEWKRDLFFAVYGTQSNVGNRDLEYFEGPGPKRYELPLGEYFQGFMNYLVFANDDDSQDPSSESQFSNLVIYEAGITQSIVSGNSINEDSLLLGDYPFLGYGGIAQYSRGEASLTDPRSVQLSGDTWQAMLFNYEVTPQTRLEFDFTASRQGDLQGIGIDTDLQRSEDDIWFRLQGDSDSFGIDGFDSLQTGAYQHYDIALGDYFQGRIKYLTFGNEDGRENPDAVSAFSNIRIYEGVIDYSAMPILSYGGTKQDGNGQVSASATGETLSLSGNTWKAIPYQYDVTPETVIEFDFSSNSEGELFGIGIDTDLELSHHDYWFTLRGSQQNFGIRDFMFQSPSINRYVLPIGEFYQGSIEYITFGNDHDVDNPTAQSSYSNLRVYEMGENSQTANFSYDVVIYAATPAGVMTAVEAAQQGKSVIILEPGSHVGGMMSSGLGHTDAKYRSAVGGLSREFFERVQEYYDQPAAWTAENPEDYDQYDPNADTMWRFEPHVAESIFEGFLDELFIPVVRQHRLDRDSGVLMNGQSITSIATEQDAIFEGKVFVDTSYEGDLMASAGVTYTIGREANNVYGETRNGVQPTNKLGAISPVDPYVVPGDPSSGLVYGVQAEQIAPTGTGDELIQAYNYRLTLSRDPSNQVPFEQPANYDESKYELLFRYYEAGNNANPFTGTHAMPNLKTDSNGAGVFTIDMIGANHDYVEASNVERELIVQEHKDYIQGLLWTMANHERIPVWKQNWISQFGLSADEFTDNGNWPYQLYVREARRMVSDYVITEANGLGTRFVEDSIGVATYNLDSHHAQRFVGSNGDVRGDGNVTLSIPAPFGISYRSIIPKTGEANNLIAPLAVSASHIAFGGIRMEPSYMVMGHAAGAAASLVIDTHTTVQDLDYSLLRQELLAGGQILE